VGCVFAKDSGVCFAHTPVMCLCSHGKHSGWCSVSGSRGNEIERQALNMMFSSQCTIPWATNLETVSCLDTVSG
jgi:hypothetical protein